MLRALLAPFWNAGERRLRSPWRLLLFAVAYVACLVGLGLALLGAPWPLLEVGAVRWAAAAVGNAAVVVVLVALAGLALDRRRLRGYGLGVDRDWWLDLGFGLLLGAALMTLVFAVEYAAGWVVVRGTFTADGPLSFRAAFLTAVVLFLAVGVSEELLLRGYVLTNLAEGFRFLGRLPAVALAVLASSGLFGALHLQNPNATLVSTAAIGLAGVLLALGYVLTGDLAIPVGLHVTWNLFQGPVYGFPVSGIDTGVAVVAVRGRGPATLTGGQFGPEAGLVGVGAMLVGAVATVGYVRLRYGGVALAPLSVPQLRWWRWASPVAAERDAVEGGDDADRTDREP